MGCDTGIWLVGRLTLDVCEVLATYLDDRETQHWGGDVTDPHAEEHSNKHVCQEHGPRPGASFAENERGHDFGDVVLAQRSSNPEAAEEKHDDGSPHSRENVPRGIWSLHTNMGLTVSAHNSQHHNQERN